MSEIFITSDTHFNHKNILNFTDKEGNKVRTFHDIHHMNEMIIQNWNKVVSPNDKVYHLGDVYFGPQDSAAEILSRLNGKKRLIVGNHDNLKSPIFQKYFQKINLWRKFPEFGLLLTHVPVHPSVLGEGRFEGKQMINVHGHIHHNDSPSELHINVSVEKTDYTPINIETLVRK